MSISTNPLNTFVANHHELLTGSSETGKSILSLIETADDFSRLDIQKYRTTNLTKKEFISIVLIEFPIKLSEIRDRYFLTFYGLKEQNEKILSLSSFGSNPLFLSIEGLSLKTVFEIIEENKLPNDSISILPYTFDKFFYLYSVSSFLSFAWKIIRIADSRFKDCSGILWNIDSETQICIVATLPYIDYELLKKKKLKSMKFLKSSERGVKQNRFDTEELKKTKCNSKRKTDSNFFQK